MSRSNWGEWRIPEILLDRMIARSPHFKLVPIFGPQPGFSPLTDCSAIHVRDIPTGSVCCCMVCHQSGMDDSPRLIITARDERNLKDWHPTDKRGRKTRDRWSEAATEQAAEPTRYRPEPKKPETRAQKRARQYAAKAALPPPSTEGRP